MEGVVGLLIDGELQRVSIRGSVLYRLAAVVIHATAPLSRIFNAQ